MKALIFDGRVVQIEPKEFEIHSDWQWVDCDDTVKVSWKYDGTNFTDPDTRTDAEIAEEELNRLRSKRNIRLEQSDWTQIPDCSLSSKQKTDWATYRTELRDITKTYQSMYVEEFKWPTKPE
jgi:hypothetical protein